MKRIMVLAAAALLVAACGKGGEGGEGGEAKADFAPGKTVEVKLDGPGVTVQAPDNLEAKSEGGKATLSAAGFPTVTVTKEANEGGSTGKSKRTGTSGIKVRFMAPTSTWTCESGPAGAHKELIVSICESMAPPKDPRFVETGCDQAEGVDKAKVEAMLKAKQPDLKRCLDMEMKTAKEFSSAHFSFSLSRTGGSTSTSHSMRLESQSAEDCAREFRQSLAKTPPLDAGDLKVSCRMVFSLY